MYVYVCMYMYACICMQVYVCMYMCKQAYVCLHNILGGIVRGVNVLPKTGGGIVRGELSYTRLSLASACDGGWPILTLAASSSH